MIFQGHAVPSIQRAMDYVRGPGGDNAPDRATLLGGQGFGFVPQTDDDVKLATAIMEHNARFETQASPTKKCALDALHVSAAWDPKQRADQDEMLEAGRYFLKSVGMENSMAIFHRHSDKKHPHMHMVASLIDPKTGLTFDRYQFRYKAQHAAIEWEQDRNQITPARQPQHDVARAAKQLDWEHLQALLRQKDGKIAYGKIDQALALGGHFGPHMVAHRVAFHKHLENEPQKENEQMARDRRAANLFRAHREQETSFDGMFNKVVEQHTPEPSKERRAILEQEVAKLEAQHTKPTVKSTVLDFFDAGDDDVHRPRRERGPQEINGNFKDMTDATTPGLLPPKRDKGRGLER